MEALDLARWQFAITTIYHFLFVPLTLGLSLLVAIMQTMYVRTGEDAYKRMTRFWGRLFIINFILGVATGIVQEFQFGMNWSEYSRFVGDIFGAPLAIEALLAFFLESTFLGLWIFGWDRLSKGVHLATIWLVVLGSNISALWILIANSFMQQPVGYAINQARGRAEMTDFGALLTNPNVWVQWPHVFTGAVATAAFFVLGISAYHLLRQRGDLEIFRRSMRIGLVAAILGTVGVAVVGHSQAQHMVQIQPMKMAAAEALWEDTKNAPLSLFTWGDENERRDIFGIHVPSLVSILAYNNPDATVRGMNSLQAEYQAKYGPGDYVPQPIWIIYWSFRAMIGAGVLMFLLAAFGLWYLFRATIERHKWFLRLLIAAITLPYLANATGWVLTEVGRQPWIVNNLLKVEAGVSPVPAGAVLLSLIVYTLLYGVLAAVDIFLMFKFARGTAGETPGIEPQPGTEMVGAY